MNHPKLSVKKGREYQILRGHPWLFSGGISQAPNKVAPGSLVDLVDNNGKFLARGYFNPATDIAVRVLTRDPSEQIDREFLARRVRSAVELRKQAIDMQKTDAFRLIHAEGDFLPGFVVDHFAGVLVVQSSTAGSDKLLDDLIDVLSEVLSPKAIVVRNDAGGRKREGLDLVAPLVVRGEVPAELTIRENDLQFGVDVLGGQKTGFFTDQREKRIALQRYAISANTLVNGFSYTGAFAVYATKANPALVTINIDESQRALDQAKRNFELNQLDPGKHEFILIDAFNWLEERKSEGSSFDTVLLDPPAFAKTHKDKPRALKGYTRMNRLGISITKPGGILVVCSCSGSVSLDEFAQCLRDASAETGREVQVLEAFLNAPDHPVSISAPEGNYLKVLFARVG